MINRLTVVSVGSRGVGRILAVALILGFAAGCAELETYTRPDHSFYVSRAVGGVSYPGDSNALFTVRTLTGHWKPWDKSVDGPPPAVNGKRGSQAKGGEMVTYFTAELRAGAFTNSLLGFQETDFTNASMKAEVPTNTTVKARMLQDRRNEISGVLLMTSECNCSTFLNRAFGNRAAGDVAVGFMQDVLTGGAAGAAMISPPSAAALSIANLIAGSWKRVNETLYLGKTFPEMEDVIQASRAKKKQEILGKRRLDYDNYKLPDLLTDIRDYDNLCSLRHGIKELRRLALMGTTPVTVVITNIPSLAVLNATPTNGPVGMEVTFTENSLGTVTSRAIWYGDGAFETNLAARSGVRHRYEKEKNYEAFLVASGPLGASTNAVLITVTNAPPVAGFTFTNEGLKAIFSDTSTGTITNRYWNFGDGAETNAAGRALEHTYKTATNATVVLTVTGEKQTASATNQVNVK